MAGRVHEGHDTAAMDDAGPRLQDARRLEPSRQVIGEEAVLAPLGMAESGGAAAEEVIKIVNATQGRAFVLSTSLAGMQSLYDLAMPELDFTCLLQGSASKGRLLERFRQTPNAVLFATSSFWQGVDVRGEQLSCVIIDKLPFAVPTDPIVAARQRYIEDEGGSSFFEYSVPQAIISLKQGLGRLIRSTTDRGVLAVLDPRLTTKTYGRLFLKSLPQCRVTSEIDELADVFALRQAVGG